MFGEVITSWALLHVAMTLVSCAEKGAVKANMMV
jgi:hypothetical protein